MWEGREALPQDVTAADVLQCCFLDDSFVEAHHVRQGHQLDDVGVVAGGERVTKFVTGGVRGYGELRVTDRVLHTLSGDGRALVVESRATLEGAGPAARLKPFTRWEVDGKHLTMRLEAVFEPAGFADRMLAGTVQSTAVSRGQVALQQWWQLARERLEQTVMQRRNSAPAVTSATATLAGVDSDDDDDDGSLVFEDADADASFSDAGVIAGLLQIVRRAVESLRADVDAVRVRRQRVEADAVECVPGKSGASRAGARLVRFANAGDARPLTQLLLPGTAGWDKSTRAASALAVFVRRQWLPRVFALVAPWALLVLAASFARRTRK